ncbi:MAG: hypothetical protein HQL30_10065 [Candidatus Omnitrophica bacterium]|nr:hypothetical protein [Candidatus Omnitrophota bacterium]
MSFFRTSIFLLLLSSPAWCDAGEEWNAAVTPEIGQILRKLDTAAIALRAGVKVYRCELGAEELFSSLLTITELDLARQVVRSTFEIQTIVLLRPSVSTEERSVIVKSLLSKISIMENSEKKLRVYIQTMLRDDLKDPAFNAATAIADYIARIQSVLASVEGAKREAAVKPPTKPEAASDKPATPFPAPAPENDLIRSLEKQGAAVNDYPVSAQTREKCILYLVELKDFQNELSARASSSTDFISNSSLLILISNISEMLEIFSRFSYLLTLETIHGNKKQYDPEALNMMKIFLSQHIYSVDRLKENIDSLSPNTTAPKETVDKLRDFHREAKDLMLGFLEELNKAAKTIEPK